GVLASWLTGVVILSRRDVALRRPLRILPPPPLDSAPPASEASQCTKVRPSPFTSQLARAALDSHLRRRRTSREGLDHVRHRCRHCRRCIAAAAGAGQRAPRRADAWRAVCVVRLVPGRHLPAGTDAAGHPYAAAADAGAQRAAGLDLGGCAI